MKVHVLTREQRLGQSPDEVFGFFAEARNLELITPGFLHFRVLSQEPERMDEGTLIRYRLRLRGIPIRWLTRIEQWDQGRRFVDTQLKEPYRYWHHTHDFEPDSGGTLMRDTVRYAMRAGPIGELVHGPLVAPDLAKIFDYRIARIEALFGGRGLSPDG